MDINRTTKNIREKQNKRLDGWNTSLPYGIAKDLGLDTIGKTPRQLWDEIQKITKTSAQNYYEQKAKKGEGTDVKIGDIDEDALHSAYQKMSAKPNKGDAPADQRFEKFRERLNKKKESWVKSAEKLSVDSIKTQVAECDRKIKAYKKNPERDGEKLAFAIEKKAIFNAELDRRPKEK